MEHSARSCCSRAKYCKVQSSACWFPRWSSVFIPHVEMCKLLSLFCLSNSAVSSYCLSFPYPETLSDKMQALNPGLAIHLCGMICCHVSLLFCGFLPWYTPCPHPPGLILYMRQGAPTCESNRWVSLIKGISQVLSLDPPPRHSKE